MDISTTDVNKQRTVLEQAALYALKLAKTKVSGTEISIVTTMGLNISTRYEKVETIEFHNDIILTITVYNNYQKGIASSTDLSNDAIKRTLDAAINIAHYTSKDLYAEPADIELLAFKSLNLDLYHPWEIDINRAIELAARAEHTALNYDHRITKTEGANFNTYTNIKVFGNSHGMLQSYCSSRYVLSSCIIAEQDEHMVRDYSYTISRAIHGLKSPEYIGKDCARRVLSRLSSRKLITMKVPVIFCADVATSLFGHLVSAITGSNVYQRSTFLLNALGKKIFPDWLNIEEKPHLLQGLGSSPFDNEGVATKADYIIKNGILQNWLMSSYSARKLGFKSNGHAGGIYNWCVSNQDVSLRAMIKKMNQGLVVTELMGQGVSIITGDYSRGAAGYWVQNGEIQYPVHEVTISSNLKEMWSNIITIGQDIEKRHEIQCGSVLIAEMNISGQ